MYRFQQKLKNFKQHLKKWNKNVFGNIFQAQKSLEKHMEDIKKKLITKGNSEALHAKEQLVKQQLEERLAQEEILWRKKSRI
jgi:hypothetical protein